MGSAGEYADSTVGRKRHSHHADRHTKENFCGAALFAGNQDADGAAFGLVTLVRRNEFQSLTLTLLWQQRGCHDRVIMYRGAPTSRFGVASSFGRHWSSPAVAPRLLAPYKLSGANPPGVAGLPDTFPRSWRGYRGAMRAQALFYSIPGSQASRARTVCRNSGDFFP